MFSEKKIKPAFFERIINYLQEARMRKFQLSQRGAKSKSVSPCWVGDKKLVGTTVSRGGLNLTVLGGK